MSKRTTEQLDAVMHRVVAFVRRNGKTSAPDVVAELGISRMEASTMLNRAIWKGPLLRLRHGVYVHIDWRGES